MCVCVCICICVSIVVYLLMHLYNIDWLMHLFTCRVYIYIYVPNRQVHTFSSNVATTTLTLGLGRQHGTASYDSRLQSCSASGLAPRRVL